MDNTIMKVQNQECVGCKACEMVCPVSAVIFKRDREGFEYPAIDTDRCIRCGKCLAACPSDKELTKIQNKIYVARNKNKDVLKSSSSGGIFTALANDVIANGGSVYGVCFDKAFNVVYVRGTNMDDVCRMRGSKYVDAYIGTDTLKNFIEDVKSKKEVLFSGTPCQIHGIKEMCAQMGLSTENVILVDFYICSGKVSSYLWNKEKQVYSAQGRLEDVSFRSKHNGWKNFGMHRKIDGVMFYDDFLVHRWSKFLDHSVSRRKTCKTCKYGGGVAKSDISLGDMWYSIPVPEKWKDNKGISIVSANTAVGLECLNHIINQLEIQEVTEPFTINNRTTAYDAEEENRNRTAFWDVYYNQGWDALCDTYAKIKLKEKLLYGVIRPLLIKTGLLDLIRNRGIQHVEKKHRGV